MVQVALIALGANQPSPAGSPADTLRSALTALEQISGLTLRSAADLQNRTLRHNLVRGNSYHAGHVRATLRLLSKAI